MDIHNKEFKHRGRNGYDSYEVDKFLDEIIDDYGDVLDQVIDLKNQVALLEEKLGDAEESNQFLNQQVQQYKDRENEVNEVLLSAQQSASQIRREAEEQAKSIVENANLNLKREEENYSSLGNDYRQLMQKINDDRLRVQQMLQQEIDNLNDDNWHKVLNEYFVDKYSHSNQVNEENGNLKLDVDKNNEDGIESIQVPDNTETIIAGDSPQQQSMDAQEPSEITNDSGATIVFPDNYKDH